MLQYQRPSSRSCPCAYWRVDRDSLVYDPLQQHACLSPHTFQLVQDRYLSLDPTMTKAEIPEVAPTRRTFLYGADIVNFFYLGGLSVDDKMSLQLKCRGFGVFEWGD